MGNFELPSIDCGRYHPHRLRILTPEFSSNAALWQDGRFDVYLSVIGIWQYDSNGSGAGVRLATLRCLGGGRHDTSTVAREVWLSTTQRMGPVRVLNKPRRSTRVWP